MFKAIRRIKHREEAVAALSEFAQVLNYCDKPDLAEYFFELAEQMKTASFVEAQRVKNKISHLYSLGYGGPLDFAPSARNKNLLERYASAEKKVNYYF
ncbi:hypothetical protein BK816_01180 [Boudabousia tangfeifanii]|uniref:Uncharacterized protein n=1 Tax=Boudabousia tangfeifanii TaxID=1912795 RepID=A0A1D9MIF4_9ACTO|nr:hypothetical protein [Boudabousia tangfeifanii]AOZ72077.1 hypothetical protein BK816_01180 [Boudabousia tangfeifanii]